MLPAEYIHIALEAPYWERYDDGIEVRRNTFCANSVRFFKHPVTYFRESYCDGSNTPIGSLFMGEYRYWLDDRPARATAIYREKINARELTEDDLDDLVERMVQRLEQKKDNSRFSIDELMNECSGYFHSYNWVSGAPTYILMDGEYYLPYNYRINDEMTEFEVVKKFDSVAQSHGFMIDGSENLYKKQGLPWNIPDIYRRKSNLITKAQKLSAKYAVKGEDGAVICYSRTYRTRHLDSMTLLRIPSGISDIKMNVGPTPIQIETISGDIILRIHRFEAEEFSSPDTSNWEEIITEKKFSGNGSDYEHPEYGDSKPPRESFFTIRNIGESDAVVLISRQKKIEYHFD